MTTASISHLLSVWVLPILSLLIFLFSLAYSWRLHKNIFSPIVIHGAGWLLPAILTAVPHQFPFTLRPITWAAIYISYFSFLFGYLLATRVKISDHRNTRRIVGQFSVWKKPIYRLVLTLIFLPFSIAFIINLNNLVTELGAFAYVEVPFGTIETTFGGVSPIVNYLYFLNGLLVLLSIIYIRAYSIDKFIFFIGGTSLTSTLFFGHKSAIILPILLATFAYYCTTLRLDFRSITLVSFTVIFSFFLVYYSGSSIHFSLDTLYGQLIRIGERILLYIAPNFANLQENVIHSTDKTFGLRSISSIIQLLSLTTIQLELPAPHLVNPAYNVGTYALPYYLDYGWIGFVLPPFVIGIASTYAYSWFLEQPSVESTVIYSIVMAMNFMTFFANHYHRIQYWWYIWIVVAIIVSKRAIGEDWNVSVDLSNKSD